MAFKPLPTWRRTSKTIILKKDSVQGIDIGIPLNIITNVFTHLHYGFDITSPYIVSLQFLIGYYTYGKDRYKDAIEYEETKYETSKEELYMSILKYRYIYKLSYCVCFYSILFMLSRELSLENTLWISSLLYSTEYYKDLKTSLPAIKPFYVSLLWTFATCILPCIVHDQDYSIFQDPLDYIPCVLNLFALTNIADIKDIDEDIQNGVKTFPIVYGEDTTYGYIFLSLALSSLLFGIHPNYYDRPWVHILFELQNIVISCICASLKIKRTF